MSLLSQLHERVNRYEQNLIDTHIEPFDETITSEQWERWETALTKELLHYAETEGADGHLIDLWMCNDAEDLPIPVMTWALRTNGHISQNVNSKREADEILFPFVGRTVTHVCQKIVAYWNERHPDVPMKLNKCSDGYVDEMELTWERPNKRHKSE